MTHPATYWAKYYLTKRSHSYARVVTLLEVDGVGGLSAEDLEQMDKKMSYPVIFRPLAKKDTASQNFLRKEGIYEAWTNPKAMRVARGILEDGPLRQMVEALILSPVKPAQAVKKIRIELGYNISVTAYELFEHYFWNRKGMSSVEWGAFLKDRQSANEEWCQLAIDARGASGVKMLLWKMGLGSVRSTEAVKGFERARETAFMMLEQISMMPPSKCHSEMYLNYLKAAHLAQGCIESSASAVKDVLDSFTAFRLRNKEILAPSVKELTGGNFSPAEVAEGGEEEMEY